MFLNVNVVYFIIGCTCLPDRKQLIFFSSRITLSLSSRQSVLWCFFFRGISLKMLGDASRCLTSQRIICCRQYLLCPVVHIHSHTYGMEKPFSSDIMSDWHAMTFLIRVKTTLAYHRSHQFDSDCKSPPCLLHPVRVLFIWFHVNISSGEQESKASPHACLNIAWFQL